MSVGKKQERKTGRYEYLDVLRGMTLISMMIYHGMWDLVYIVGVDIPWFSGKGAYIWQQSICWTFILLAGFCWSLGREQLKRGCIVLGAGWVITLVTVVFMPGQRVVFGVLTLLGSSMLLLIPLEKLLRKVHSAAGIGLAAVLFVLFQNVNDGYLGVGDVVFVRFPKEWYDKGLFMTYLGFVDNSFYSTDYFSLLPWFFLFVTGYFLYRWVQGKGWLESPFLGEIRNKPLAFLGRNSLWVYLLHQPVIYGVIMLLF